MKLLLSSLSRLQSHNKMEDYNQYFCRPYDGEEDEQARIEPLPLLPGENPTLLEDLKQQKEPKLDEFPFDFDKKQEATLDLMTDMDSRMQVQTVGKFEAQTVIFFQQKTVQKYREVFRGSKDDTVELNINFKTLLVHYFKQLRMLNELNELEVIHLNEFSERVPSFQSLMTFFKRTPENQGIRHRALSFLESSECIRRILTGRCKMRTKLQMIKFIEKVRLNILTHGKGYKWKDVVKG